MSNVEDKIKNLDTRISDISNQISELEETRMNLIILKREFHMDNVRETLENSFTDELKEKLTDKFND